MEEKIYNKKSHRWIAVNGAQYKKLLKQGFRVNEDDQLSPPKPTSTTTSTSTSTSTTSTYNKDKNIDDIFGNVVLLENLEPKDLLALYLTHKNLASNINKAIDVLNRKYNIKSDNFIDFYKQFNLLSVPDHLKYLYDLEQTRYINSFDNITILEDNIFSLFDKIYEYNKKLKLSHKNIPYAYNLFFIYLTNLKKKITNKQLKLYGSVCHYLATLMFEEYIPEIDNYLNLTNRAFNKSQFTDALIDVFNILNGKLIYPCPILFADKKYDDLVLLTTLASMIPSLALYKPSLITETCNYMLTGNYKIYHIDEITPICNIINTYIDKFISSSLSYIQPRAESIKQYIKYPCGEKGKPSILSPLHYNEEWHIGGYKKINVLGEGTYGKVSRVKRNQCGKEYAIKKSSIINESLQEISILNLLKNKKYIISICGYDFSSADKVETVIPLMSHPIREIKKEYCRQILEGVQAIHNYDIIHRDLKVENIMYDKNTDSVNIIDFGLSVIFQSLKTTNLVDFANTASYRPPECLLGVPFVYNQKIDIWAVGCIFYYLLTKYYVVNINNRIEEFLDDIFRLRGTPNENTWPGISKLINLSKFPKYSARNLKPVLGDFTDLVTDCLTVNPDRRPTATELLQKYF